MLQLNNKTPFAASMALFPDEEGIDTLYVMVKASFNIGPQWTLLDEQMPPVAADIYWGEPESSSLKIASDYHIGKPSSDIIMTGLACAPDRKMVKNLDVNLTVGQVSKTVRVYGDRQWIDGQASEPVAFETLPMVFEKCFGGVHLVDGEVDSAEMRNPLGCGYAGKRTMAEMNGVPLPNLEDPQNLITRHTDTPPPHVLVLSHLPGIPAQNLPVPMTNTGKPIGHLIYRKILIVVFSTWLILNWFIQATYRAANRYRSQVCTPVASCHSSYRN